ncbi:glycyl-radical enzyme activating protein [Aureibacter tunicatorum]|uniref:Pyruvate formate lyase activating enzyme n=1 Tax=Aureibacter tunicatorum TaxID=866807 RepID=A0AAE4BQT6_9BACT|nr:glycyl-radical enzyme activating protein [Aureibacter tunicatorum]MDR6237926.1 pyruvate formate lyase activating enzyme [Aureibacter tunicatorum]BDD02959.1 pyruvate formate lyase-activating protein [Aureibacter tunicatorum]
MIKGKIFNIKKYAVNDGPGIRQTIFFQGCPLSCWWCHNPESQSLIPQNNNYKKCWDVSVDDLLDSVEKERIFFDDSNGGVTCSGGEPLLQAKFVSEFLSQCKARELHTCIDTSGHASLANLKLVLPHTDMFLYDLKSLDEKKHKKYTGVGIQRIVDNLDCIISQNKAINLRIPIIPQVNDSYQDIQYFIKFIKDRPALSKIDLLAFHRLGKHKYEKLGMEYKADIFHEPEHLDMKSIAKLFVDSGINCSIN